MGGPGSGRRPASQTNGSGWAPPPPVRSVTLGEMLASVRPAPTTSSPPPPPPPALATPTPTPPAERAGNRSAAEIIAYIGTNLGVVVIGNYCRRHGKEPRDPSHDDLDRTKEATADAIVRALGDAEVPWWLGLATAWGNLALSMWVGAKPLPDADAAELAATTPTTPTPTTTTTPPSPLGQAPPPRDPRRPPPPPRGGAGGLPAVEATVS